jgi:microcystin-dependent protein
VARGFLRGRTPIGIGQGPGLMQWVNGQRVGSETVSLTQTELPAHTHAYVPELAALGIALVCAAAFPARRVKKKS